MEPKELRECLSQNLKKYRKQRGWSQFELAEKAEVSEQTINSIEGLRLWPSDKTLSKIATALHIEMYKLFVTKKLILKSESIVELKHAVINTVEELVHNTLQDWETEQTG
ncbi:MAG: helix-turn-helix transcriptional regulator [Spirochaetaceae bacterium]|nr:helix-turn-helix transcriptional regulator [Spirochaetaceae bacterium]